MFKKKHFSDLHCHIDGECIRVLKREARTIPVRRETAEMEISWRELEEVDYREKENRLRLRLHPTSPLLKREEEEFPSGIEVDLRDRFLSFDNRFRLPLEEVAKKFQKYLRRGRGPEKIEIVEEQFSLFLPFLVLAGLAGAALMMASPAPEGKTPLLFAGLILGSVFFLALFLFMGIKRRQLVFCPQGIKLTSFVIRNGMEEHFWQEARIPWDNLLSAHIIDQKEKRGLGLCIRNAEFPGTELPQGWEEEIRDNYRHHRCDVIIPIEDRARLLTNLKEVGHRLQSPA